MELKITCPLRWREAQAKAEELNDRSLNDCIMRLMAWITPWEEDINKAKERYDKASVLFHKTTHLQWHFEENKDYTSLQRVCNIYDRFSSKHIEAANNYYDLVCGGKSYIKISKDYEPYSFSFGEFDGNDNLICNGGIIFYNDKWHIHT